MTEITRVPLLPIAKGSLGKIWLGVALAIVAGGGLAWATMPKMVSVETITAGEGPHPTLDDVAVISYKGMLKDGTIFDSSPEAPLPLRGVVPGFTKALQQMQRGGKYQVEIPAALGYGAQKRRDSATGELKIPANSDLTFEIEMLGFMPMEQFQMMQQQQMLQHQQQMQQQQGRGAPGRGPGRGPGGMSPPMPEGAPSQ